MYSNSILFRCCTTVLYTPNLELLGKAGNCAALFALAVQPVNHLENMFERGGLCAFRMPPALLEGYFMYVTCSAAAECLTCIAHSNVCECIGSSKSQYLLCSSSVAELLYQDQIH